MTQSESCCVATMNYPAVSSVHWNFPFGVSPCSRRASAHAKRHRVADGLCRQLMCVKSGGTFEGIFEGVTEFRRLVSSFCFLFFFLKICTPEWFKFKLGQRDVIFCLFHFIISENSLQSKFRRWGETLQFLCRINRGDCVTLPAPCQHRSQSLHCRRGLIAQ